MNNSSDQKKLLELQNQKKGIQNLKECQKRDFLISKLNSASDHKFETVFNTIKYKDIDFEQCLATANKKLLELNTKLSNLENIPENSVDIEMIKREIRDTIINIKDINYVKDNLLEIENKCFKKPL